MASEHRQLGTTMVNSQPGFLTNQDLVMVSVLQDPSDKTFPADALGSEWQQEEGTQTPACAQSDNASSHCQSNGSNSGNERENSDSMSPGPSSPQQDQIQGRIPINQVMPSGKSKTSASEKLRRYSCDESSRFIKNNRIPFHPYERHFSETHHSLLATECSLKNMGSMENFEMLASTDLDESELFTHVPELSTEPPWCRSLHHITTNHNHDTQIMQASELKLKAIPLVGAMQQGENEMCCYQSPGPQVYSATQPFQQYSTEQGYPVAYITSSHYPYQRIAPQASLESQPPPYPKPIYSYSILIFMALKNSRNGSLPVSEIYNFMTEHFPYFKTAPDGWKNSVRHNLSLNKCFEKVENKSGNSSRKGCLWALNPSKIDKMQEELQKWKRKDPVAVRKSMAKPEELDRLIGDKTENSRPSAMTCSAVGVSSSPAPMQMSFQTSLSSSIPASLHPINTSSASLHERPQPVCHQSLCFTSPSPGYPHIQQPPGVHQTHYPPLEIQGEPLPQYSPQDSPLPAHSPPIHNLNAIADHSPARTIQDTLMEGDLSNDIDALNPSLTDFELQGNLWEELKDDSLTLDLIASSQTPPHGFPFHLSNGLNGDSTVDLSSPRNPSQGGLADLHLTTLYSFMELDTVSAPYLNNSGSKQVALV
ncbi:forkhead box protein N1 [Microcaecilia unicolor]|uniref:Forkhead box protein N1 n=1 Tax=Microcaecilia unicolor TaxID=1415580 RepID=A0A6P7WVI5_9AMPH|nr:forkhead box protein N1 [Microcaecilia unicolor]XP_030041885.1 forkhead box protein N1 [Microcaecilia unicolor]